MGTWIGSQASADAAVGHFSGHPLATGSSMSLGWQLGQSGVIPQTLRATAPPLPVEVKAQYLVPRAAGLAMDAETQRLNHD
jgi:hypothetical protein